MTPEPELLRQFAEEHSEAAFRELVQRKIDFVYAAALRQVGGDAHLAEDVVQNVFLDLARKAGSLTGRPNVTGWLYTSARFAAAKALRARSRRLIHETEAHAMHEILSVPSPDETNWNEIRPVLDTAMHELGETDREAILLRFFEGRSLAEVGAAIGLAENSARMRVERALEKLRVRLARRGITSTAAALGVALAGQPAVSAPVGLAATVAGASLAGATITGGGIALTVASLKLMSTTKLAFGALAVATALGVGAYLGAQYHAARLAPDADRAAVQNAALATLREENRRLTDELARATAVSSPAVPSGDWRMLVDLKQKKMIELDPKMSWVSPSGKLSEAFAKVFELSPSETTTLQDALNDACRRIENFQRENSTITHPPKDPKGLVTDAVTIALRPFPTAGGAVYDALMASFARTLGPERNAAFLTLGAERVETAFAHFGAEERTMTFFYMPKMLNGPYLVAGKVRVGAEETDTPGDYRSRQDVEEHLGTIARLIPSDFAGGK